MSERCVLHERISDDVRVALFHDEEGGAKPWAVCVWLDYLSPRIPEAIANCVSYRDESSARLLYALAVEKARRLVATGATA